MLCAGLKLATKHCVLVNPAFALETEVAIGTGRRHHAARLGTAPFVGQDEDQRRQYEQQLGKVTTVARTGFAG